MLDIYEVLENTTSIAMEVGKMQSERLLEDIKSTTKSTGIDFVTEIDLLSERMIIDRIQSIYGTHNILSEEAGFIDKGSDYTWVIDPLDGTTNYYHHFPIFCVSIALKEKDETLLGVVYVPVLDELFYAVKGKGAFLNDRKITVSKTEAFGEAVLVTGFPYDKAIAPENNLDIFNSLVIDIAGIRRTGSAAFDLCSVAAGRIDGYWELKLAPWDMQAGELIVREAGGEIKTSEMKRANGDLGINIIAGNNKISSELENRIAKVGNYFNR